MSLSYKYRSVCHTTDTVYPTRIDLWDFFCILDIHRRGVYKNHIWKFLYTRICVNEANLYSKERQGLQDCFKRHQQDNRRQAYHQGLHPSHPTGGMCGTSRKERGRKNDTAQSVERNATSRQRFFERKPYQ